MPSLTGYQKAPMVVRLTDHILTEEGVYDGIMHSDERAQRQLFLDLSRVSMPTAGGIGALVGLNRRMSARGGRLVLLNVQPWAYEVFEVTRLTELMDVRVA
jgi:anti-anti-sigma factor